VSLIEFLFGGRGEEEEEVRAHPPPPTTTTTATTNLTNPTYPAHRDRL